MSDEAHFHLNMYIDKQNCRFWSTENPRELHQHRLYTQKCTVWCGFMAKRVIEIFDERIISKNVEFVWPPRLPDLTTPCFFFFWSYSKERVYINKL
ncbi:uncharacterized protein LOC143151410 [Ptiloglossa arizonensis]|uniref:uncharacterized protein LOC143151410 n=1 Tax=Ptiloglossa arizonensis TaxID=3350558 RepID=UPI003F9FBD3B